jgi:hypothetical protein
MLGSEIPLRCRAPCLSLARRAPSTGCAEQRERR